MSTAFFEPRNVAVVGASDKRGSLGWGLTFNVLSSFPGKVYLVNVKGGSIEGRIVYRRVSDIGEPVDLALIITPSNTVPEVLEDAGEAGARAAIVYSSGFSEAGFKNLEDHIVNVARKHGIRLLGPNCVGVIDGWTPINATFISMERQKMPPRGSISIVSQSGALGSLIMDLMGERLIGLRRFASVGNAADVKMWELLEFFGEDPLTEAVGLYFESLSEGRKLIDKLSEVSERKPVVVLRGGASESGSRAASTHVAALSAPARVVEGLLKGSGVLRAETMSEFIAILELLGRKPPRPSKDNVIVVTNTGGMGVLVSDSLELKGLKLGRLSGGLEAKLRRVLPPYVSINNPLDLSGGAPTSIYREAVKTILESQEAGVLLVVNQPQTIAMDSENFIEFAGELRGLNIPVIVLVEGSGYSRELANRLRLKGLPVASTPEEAAAMVWALSASRRGGLERPPEHPLEARAEALKVIESVRREGREFLLEHEAKALARAYGLETPRGGLASSVNEAVALADSIGYPVVAKIVSPDVLHKSDVGGVILGLRSPEDVIDAYEKLRRLAVRFKARFTGVLIEEMVSTRFEASIGALRDPLLGPIVMAGLGGVLVELLGDVTFRKAPLSVVEALEMIGETSLGRLVEGYRGFRADARKIAEAIVNVGLLISSNPEIAEVDVNPLAVLDDEVKALDVRVKLTC
ncbi:MAG: acetate--CoA ligase family protein [Thermoprotei archaeon]|nr:acetate--CoA ligase family protein [Thermoprotei archaeon]